MAGLGEAASIIAILQMTGSVLTFCYDYARSSKERSATVERVTTELEGFKDILQRLEDISIKNPADSAISALRSPNG